MSSFDSKHVGIPAATGQHLPETREDKIRAHLESIQIVCRHVAALFGADRYTSATRVHDLVKPPEFTGAWIEPTGAIVLRITDYLYPRVGVLSPLGLITAAKGSDGLTPELWSKMVDSLGLVEMSSDIRPTEPPLAGSGRYFKVTRFPDGSPVTGECVPSSSLRAPQGIQALWEAVRPAERAAQNGKGLLPLHLQADLDSRRELMMRVRSGSHHVTSEGLTEQEQKLLPGMKINVEDIDGQNSGKVEVLSKLCSQCQRYGFPETVQKYPAILEIDEVTLAILCAAVGERFLKVVVVHGGESDPVNEAAMEILGGEAAPWLEAAIQDSLAPTVERERAFRMLCDIGPVGLPAALAVIMHIEIKERSRVADLINNFPETARNFGSAIASSLEQLIAESDLNTPYSIFGAIRGLGQLAPERIVASAIKFGSLREDNQWGLDLLGEYGRHAEAAIPLLEEKIRSGNNQEVFYAQRSLSRIRAAL